VIWSPETGILPLEYSCIITISTDDIFRVLLVRVPDHIEETIGFFNSIDRPSGIELLMPAVLRVDLREHEKLDVEGVSCKRPL